MFGRIERELRKMVFGESSHRDSEMARPTQAPLHQKLLSSQSGGWHGSDARAVFIDYRTYKGGSAQTFFSEFRSCVKVEVAVLGFPS